MDGYHQIPSSRPWGGLNRNLLQYLGSHLPSRSLPYFPEIHARREIQNWHYVCLSVSTCLCYGLEVLNGWASLYGPGGPRAECGLAFGRMEILLTSNELKKSAHLSLSDYYLLTFLLLPTRTSSGAANALTSAMYDINDDILARLKCTSCRMARVWHWSSICNG